MDTGAKVSGTPKQIDLSKLLAKLSALPFSSTGNGGRYVSIPGGDDICAWVDASAGANHHVRFARLRRSAMPQAERGGNLTPVQLARGGSLYEASHLVFFPNNIVGVEFNFFAPRAPRFASYLQRVLKSSNPYFSLEQLLRSDVADQLDRQQGLRVFDLMVRPSYVSSVQAASRSLGEALSAANSVGDGTLVGVYLKADPRKHDAMLSDRVMSAARALARRRDLRDGAARLQVRSIGPDGRMVDLDLLEDALVRADKVAAISPSSRAVDSRAAYAAITSAFDDVNNDGLLDVSPGLSAASNDSN